jgi:hypothetical protein
MFVSWTWWIIAWPYRGSLFSVLEQSIRDWCWSASRWFCPYITTLPTFHTHQPRLESLVLWSHFKPHPLYLQSRPSSCVPFLFKQACKMSASCSTFDVRKLDSAAVCFVTLHVLNSTRPLSLSNVTTLFLLDFVRLQKIGRPTYGQLQSLRHASLFL